MRPTHTIQTNDDGLPGSDLPQEVLRFLKLDSVAELLYDADEDTQKLAEELREKASRECD